MTMDLGFLTQDTSQPGDALRGVLDRIAARPGRSKRWTPRRLIVQNFWIFPYQEFHFAEGRLNLRGANQSGKSVVLGVTIPLILDGNTRPERLDPFGTRDRTIEYFLLGRGEKGPKYAYDERTAYLALEFVHGATGEVRTVGIGLRMAYGSRNRDFCGFLLADGREIGRSLDLRTEGARSRPITFGELEQALAADARNRFVKTAPEYEQLVNEALFGFEKIGEYQDLIKTLLQLRSPKLNGDITLDQVRVVLEESLPPLDNEILLDASESIANIADLKERIHANEREVDAVRAVDQAYGYFLNELAQLEAVSYLEAQREHGARAAALDRARKAIATREKEMSDLAEKRASLRESLRVARAEREALENSEAFRSREALVQAEAEARGAAERRDAAASRLSVAREALREKGERLDALARTWDRRVDELEGALSVAEEAVKCAEWALAGDALRGARRTLGRAAADNREDPAEALGLDMLSEAGLERVRLLQTAATAVREADAAKAEYDAARRHAESLRTQRDAADRAVAGARATVDAHRDAVVAAVEHWAGERHGPVVPEAILEGVETAVREYEDPRGEYRSLVRPVEEFLRSERSAVWGERDAVMERRAALVRERNEILADLEAWRERKEGTPKPRPGQEAARLRLDELGVRAVPLYMACDFAPGVERGLAVRVERALEESGLLDALLPTAGDDDRVRAALAEDGRTDRVLVSAPPVESPSLADLLVPAEDAPDPDGVRRLLRAVGVSLGEGSATSVGEDGSWSLGILAGHAGEEGAGRVRYVGKTNRLREREEAVARLTESVQEAEGRLAEAEDEIAGLKAREHALEREAERLRDLPELSALQGAVQGLANAVVEHARLLRDTVAADQAATEALDAYRAKRIEAERAAHRVAEVGVRSAEALEEAARTTDSAMHLVRAFAGACRELGHVRESRALLMRDIEREAGRAAEAEKVWEREREGAADADAALESIRRLLEQAGVSVDDLLARARDLAKQEDALENKLSEAKSGLDRLEANLERDRAEEAQRADEARRAEAALIDRDRALRARLRAEPHATLKSAVAAQERGGAAEAAADLLGRRDLEAPNLRDNVREDVDRGQKALGDALRDHLTTLTEYQPAFDDDLGRRLRMRNRDMVPMRPEELLAELEAKLEENRSLLKEGEAGLFRDFFLNEAGMRIHQRIVEADEMTRRVSALLSDHPLSEQNDVLEIEWRPRRPDPRDPESADYAKLVDLLAYRDIQVLPERDAEWIANFFRVRIEELTRRDKTGQLDVTFADALRDALDYRKWYEFDLFTRTPGQQRVRVKRNSFGIRSGAEKALIILLPLLTAAHVRLSGARPDAPKLVGMDEAFAGVDTANIARMFDILVQMDYGWVMTSQDLWGVADTIPGCSTYELIRRDTTLVAILHLWDGRRKLSALDPLPESGEEADVVAA